MHLLGPPLILLFCLSQAVRDVYFGGLFQGIGFFSVILVAFAISTVVFGALTLWRRPQDIAVLRREWPTTLAMIGTTTFSWPCYFFGLSQIDPSVVNTIHNGMAPLTAVGLAWAGSRLTGAATESPPEYACYLGIAATIAALWWVVLSGQSGLAGHGLLWQAAGLAALIASGSAITVSLLQAKQLHSAGAGPEAVTAVRYLMVIVVAAVVEALRPAPPAHVSADNIALLAVAGTLLMVMPVFILQVGIEHTHPVTAQVIRALGPALVFVLEQIDERIRTSLPVLVCIAAYSVLAIAANVARARRGE